DVGAALLGVSVPNVVVVNAGGWVDLCSAVAWLRAQGHAQILAEAGPTTFGELVAADLVDELFLTVSSVLAGRSAAANRLGLVETISLLPERRVAASLLSVRRGGGHLFLRYAFRGSTSRRSAQHARRRGSARTPERRGPTRRRPAPPRARRGRARGR